MKLFSIILWMSVFFASSFQNISYAKNHVVLKDIDWDGSGKLRIFFQSSISLKNIVLKKVRNILQLELKNTSAYPAKVISLRGKKVSKIFAYQYSKNLSRIRIYFYESWGKKFFKKFKPKISLSHQGRVLLLNLLNSRMILVKKHSFSGKKKVQKSTATVHLGNRKKLPTEEMKLLEQVLAKKKKSQRNILSNISQAKKDHKKKPEAINEIEKKISAGFKKVIFFMIIFVVFGLWMIFFSKKFLKRRKKNFKEKKKKFFILKMLWKMFFPFKKRESTFLKTKENDSQEVLKILGKCTIKEHTQLIVVQLREKELLLISKANGDVQVLNSFEEGVQAPWPQSFTQNEREHSDFQEKTVQDLRERIKKKFHFSKYL